MQIVGFPMRRLIYVYYISDSAVVVYTLSCVVMRNLKIRSQLFKTSLNGSHTVAYNPNARRAYEKSQDAEDFGRIN